MPPRQPVIVTVKYVDHAPLGYREFEIPHHSLRAHAFPRAGYDRVRPAFQDEEGVYLLVGNSPGMAERPFHIYVGQGRIHNRLTQHEANADRQFWSQTVVFTGTARDPFEESIRHYVEAELCERARRAEADGLVCVVGRNSRHPTLASLTYNRACRILDDMDFVFPLVGLGFLAGHREPAAAEARDAEPVVHERVFELAVRRRAELAPIEAKMVKRGGQWVVLAGSLAARDESSLREGQDSAILRCRARLREDGTLRETEPGGPYRFIRDAPFPSPSTAAGVVLARAANGLLEWRHLDRPLADFPEATDR